MLVCTCVGLRAHTTYTGDVCSAPTAQSMYDVLCIWRAHSKTCCRCLPYRLALSRFISPKCICVHVHLQVRGIHKRICMVASASDLPVHVKAALSNIAAGLKLQTICNNKVHRLSCAHIHILVRAPVYHIPLQPPVYAHTGRMTYASVCAAMVIMYNQDH